MPRAVLLGALLFVLSTVPLQLSQAASVQRDHYLEALEYIRKGQFSRSRAVEKKLEGYPLKPYLEYHRLNNSLSQTSSDAIDSFRENHPDLPVTPLLYQRWLIVQGKRRQWQTLHARRYDTQNAELACYFARAQYGIGQKDQALDNTTTLWAKPKSQPKACDPIFAVWRKTPRFTQSVIWQRFSGAMAAREYVLARYLQRYFVGEHLKAAKAYYDLRRQPERVTWRGTLSTDSVENREAIGYGITRLSTRKPDKAALAWQRFRQSHAFSPAQRQRLDDQVALGLATNNRFPRAEQREQIQSEFAIQGLLKAAIAHQQWTEVAYWAGRESATQGIKARTRYWQGRAYLELDQPSDGKALFASLAQERSYYGFLAAAQLNAPAQLQAMSAHQLSLEAQEQLTQIPGIARAVELFATGDDLNGRREWYRQLADQDQDIQHHMAHLAQRIGRLYLAIQTANNAGARDDLSLRFPEAFGPLFNAAALRHGVDGNLLRAIARQESAFQTKAISSAGALGLMQVMPATGKIAVRRGGLKRHLGSDLGQAIKKDLHTPERNIEIGAFHLSWLLDRYNNQRPLAIAAYNAGESRADRWLKSSKGGPMDVWIETIPFKETRNYVQNVLAFEVVYRALNQRPAPILGKNEWRVPSA
jgi:soluble lytic murein transglycosylase